MEEELGEAEEEEETRGEAAGVGEAERGELFNGVEGVHACGELIGGDGGSATDAVGAGVSGGSTAVKSVVDCSGSVIGGG